MSSSGAKRICVGFCDRTQCTTIKSGHIGLWTKMRRSGGQFSGPESSLQIRFLADFITTTSESRFSVHTAEIVGRIDLAQGVGYPTDTSLLPRFDLDHC